MYVFLDECDSGLLVSRVSVADGEQHVDRGVELQCHQLQIIARELLFAYKV